MILNKTKLGKKKFDTSEKPWKSPWYIKALQRVLMAYYKVITGYKLKKTGMEGVEPPYLILQNHTAFLDFGLVADFVRPDTTAFVSSIEEFVGREWLMRACGCMYKRKFTPDVNVIKNIVYSLKTNKKSVTIYPEARFSIAGVTEEGDLESYARLIRLCKVPVVMGIGKGTFIMSPQFAKHPYKKIPIKAEFKLLFTAEETQTLSKEQIVDRLKENFVYDDFKYWQENGFKVKSKYRAKNLHKVLYQCPHCNTEFSMNSDKNRLFCERCGHEWELLETGFLQAKEGETYFNHVPDWYRWERENVKKQVEEGTYALHAKARLEHLECSHTGFKKLGTVDFYHDQNGFTLNGKLDDGSEFNFNRSVPSMYSCHIEYDFKKRGDAIDLATQDETYFVFPELYNHLTKIHLATEELFKFHKLKEQNC